MIAAVSPRLFSSFCLAVSLQSRARGIRPMAVVLVVEDDEQVRILPKSILQEAGHIGDGGDRIGWCSSPVR